MTVPGQVELFQLSNPSHEELCQAVLDRYLPKQGPAFETWLDREDPVETRIVAGQHVHLQPGSRHCIGSP
jgi:hypothetical protein